MTKLLVATHNKGKVAEFRELLAEAGIECLSLSDANVTFDVEETADTFIGNATLKATQYAEMMGMLTLADDSGIEIDALNGAPGVYSARYGGREISQPARNQLVLTQLADVPDAARTARFRCMMVLCDAQGKVLHSADGRCEGSIAHAPAGTHGFGYDPIFQVDDTGKTMAQLNSAEKHAISHRGHALRLMVPYILKLVS